MAAKTWNGSTTSWNTGGNWSPPGVPGVGDDVTFDGTSVQNCTLDVATAALNSLTLADAYTGAFNANGYAVNVTGGGNVDLTSGGTVNLGGGAWSCAGNWASGTLTGGGSTVTLSGTSKTVNAGTVYNAWNVTVSGTYTTATNRLYLATGYTLTVNGTLTANHELRMQNGVLAGSGVINGTSQVYFYQGGTCSFTGSIACATFLLDRFITFTAAPAAITAAATFRDNAASNMTVTLVNGLVFCSSAVFQSIEAAGSYTIANNTNNPSLTFQGDVTILETAGTVSWTKGTGTITLSGSANQNIAFAGKTVEDLVVNKSAGNLVMTGAVTTDSFTGAATGTGDFDPNGQAITVLGDCGWAAAFLFDSAADCMNGCTWIVGGNFTADGQTLNATAAWTLTVTGTAVASGIGSVQYSDADAGTVIDASAGPWTDGGNNFGWNFGVTAGGHPAIHHWSGVPYMVPGPVLAGRSW